MPHVGSFLKVVRSERYLRLCSRWKRGRLVVGWSLNVSVWLPTQSKLSHVSIECIAFVGFVESCIQCGAGGNIVLHGIG